MNHQGATVYVIHRDPNLRQSACALAGSMDYRTVMFASAEEFFDHYQGDHYGCILTDLRLQGISGLQLLEETNRRKIPLPVIVVTAHAQIGSAVQVMRHGAVTLLEIPYQDHDLREAIGEATGRSETERARTIQRQLVKFRIGSLNDKERQVMELVIDGLPNKVIAKRLNVSVRTVESRRHAIFEKMKVRSLAELVRTVVDSQL